MADFDFISHGRLGVIVGSFPCSVRTEITIGVVCLRLQVKPRLWGSPRPRASERQAGCETAKNRMV